MTRAVDWDVRLFLSGEGGCIYVYDELMAF